MPNGDPRDDEQARGMNRVPVLSSSLPLDQSLPFAIATRYSDGG